MSIQAPLLILLLVVAALAVGALAVALRRSRRRRFEERMVAESGPRVAARLARLGGGNAPAEPVASAPFGPAVPIAAAAFMATPEAERVGPVDAPVSYPQRPRSISSALVPWAGDRAAATAGAASIALRPSYGLRSGESTVIARAAMVSRPSTWRPEASVREGAGAPDARWRIWRDASAALVAFALVGLVLVGGNLLRLPSGPPPNGQVPVVAIGTPRVPSSASVIVVAGDASDAPLVISTPTPGPVITPAPTPPLTIGSKDHQATNPTSRPTTKPTAKPTAKPTPTPAPPVAEIVCPATGTALVPVVCSNLSTAGTGVTYQWLVGTDGTTWTPESTTATFDYPFPVAGFYYIELVVTKGTRSTTSTSAAINIS